MYCRPVDITQRVLIECPSQVQTSLAASANDFETFNGVFCLRLPLLPEHYAPVKTYADGDPKYVRTLAYAQFAARTYEYAIEFKIADERDTIFYVIEQIATLSGVSLQLKQEVRLFDFVRPEVEDVILARSTIPATIPYTLRTGVVNPPSSQVGRIVGEKGVGSFKGGFTFKFLEKTLRRR